MSQDTSATIKSLSPGDTEVFRQMLALFAELFNDPDSYAGALPRNAYVEKLLSGDQFIALVALKGDAVVGALAAYELKKFEQERSEIYIYDLAVAAGDRRQGIATRLIEHLKVLARSRGAYVIFVQADLGDDPAIALYSKLGVREDVLHFDIAPRQR